MTTNITVTYTVTSDVAGNRCYAMVSGNVLYDVKDQTNIDLLREFIVNNVNQTGYEGILLLTSTATGRQYHSGTGTEEFTGTITESFPDLNSPGNPITTPDNYENYVYAAIQHGYNRSLWTIQPSSKAESYYMFRVHSASGKLNKGGVRLTTLRTPNSYVLTSNGRVNFGIGSDIIANHVVISSTDTQAQYVSYTIFSDTQMHFNYTDGYTGTLDEFIIMRVSEESTITGFGFSVINTSDWHQVTFSVRKKSSPGGIPEFDAALNQTNNAIQQSGPIRNNPRHQALLSMFDEVLYSGGGMATMEYNIATAQGRHSGSHQRYDNETPAAP